MGIVVATIYDSDGTPFITFKGKAQDVADACVIYVTNMNNPLGGDTLIDILGHEG